MRRSIAIIPCRASSTSSIAAAFSTSSSGGGGRGRGGGSPFPFIGSSRTEDEPKYEDAAPPPQGHGRGRVKPVPSSPILSSFSSFVNNDSKPAPLGRGRGFVPSNTTSPPPPEEEEEEEESELRSPKSDAKKSFLYEESEAHPGQDKSLPNSIMDIVSGTGRGKPIKSPGPQSRQPRVENRHIRRPRVSDVAAANNSSNGDQLSKEEKVKRAREILSRGGEQGGGRGMAAVRGGRGVRGDRGRGMGRGRGDDIDREAEYELEADESEDDEGLGLDPAEVEEVIELLGPEFLNLMEGVVEDTFHKEACREALEDPRSDVNAFLDAFEANLRIECEPEYLMEEVGTNPDIDEKPPIPLRDALEKMKPFLMAYNGIQSQEKWERVLERAMKKAPLIKEDIDYYGGPDRVTAKEQQEELERVAKTLPASAPDSIKRFTDRAVLSLQSNPGWRFDKKCKVMDKLVREVSKQYV